MKTDLIWKFKQNLFSKVEDIMAISRTTGPQLVCSYSVVLLTSIPLMAEAWLCNDVDFLKCSEKFCMLWLLLFFLRFKLCIYTAFNVCCRLYTLPELGPPNSCPGFYVPTLFILNKVWWNKYIYIYNIFLQYMLLASQIYIFRNRFILSISN